MLEKATKYIPGSLNEENEENKENKENKENYDGRYINANHLHESMI